MTGRTTASYALRIRAAAHEIRCKECRVTWLSWAGRLFGDRRAYEPLRYGRG